MTARDGATLTAALLVLLAGAALTHLIRARAATLTPGQAVTAFYAALLRGDVGESLSWIHPQHREKARRMVTGLRRRGLEPAMLTRAVLPVPGAGRLRVGVGEQIRVAPRRWRVQVLAKRGRALQRRWTPVRGTPEHWYLDENPFAAAGRRTRRLGRSALARLR